MVENSKKRRPRRERQPRSNFILADRDRQILRFVDEYGILQAPHLSLLLGRSLRTTRRRLRELYHNNHLERLSKETPNQAEIYRPRRTNTGGRIFRRHALRTADFMASLENACRAREDVRFLRLAEILERFAPDETKKRREPHVWEVKARTGAKTLKPDKIFVLRLTRGGKRGTKLLFLETDRGTERGEHKSKKSDRRQTTIRSKMERYLWSYERWDRRDPGQTPYGLNNFRVLFVTTTRARAENLLKLNRTVARGQGSRLFLFATHEDFAVSVDRQNNVISSDPLKTVWLNGRGEELSLLD